MLVLSRNKDESIIIGDSIEVTVLEIKGEHVKLGISAPRNVRVHRKEVFLAIQAENAASAELPKIMANLEKIIKKSSNK